MKILKDIDYVSLYADKLREDNRYFVQQKMLIDSQIRMSHDLFLNKFGKKEFKQKAREYLKARKII